MTWQFLASPALTLVASLIGIAAMWGMLRSTVDHLKAEVNRLGENVGEQRELFHALREEVHVRFAESEAHRPNGRRKRRS